jgi:hypothetical protein
MHTITSELFYFTLEFILYKYSIKKKQDYAEWNL